MNTNQTNTTPWTPNEDVWLRDNSYFRGTRACMAHLNKTYHQIKDRCKKFKFKLSKVDFTYDKKSKIIELYQQKNISIAEMTKLLGVDKLLITNTVKAAGIFQPRQINKIWTDEEILYLKQNFQNKTNEELCLYFNIQQSRLQIIVNKLKLKREYVDPFNLDLFKNFTPEFVYFLGYFWADGSVRSNYPTLTIQKEDGLQIKDLISSFGKSGQYEYYPPNRKPTLSFKFYSKGLQEFLIKNDYYNKSTDSPTKILNLIPEKFHYLFYRGWLDGDGCICLTKNTNKSKVFYCGSFGQNWRDVLDLGKKLNVDCGISKRIRLNGRQKSSYAHFQGLENTLPLLNYIYQNREIDKIGLTRKHNKYLELISKTRKTIDKTIGIRKDTLYTKSNKNIVVSITQNRETLPIKQFSNLDEAFEYKKNQIEFFKTKEYRLRTLIDYWDFSNQINEVAKRIKTQSDNPRPSNPSILFRPHTILTSVEIPQQT